SYVEAHEAAVTRPETAPDGLAVAHEVGELAEPGQEGEARMVDAKEMRRPRPPFLEREECGAESLEIGGFRGHHYRPAGVSLDELLPQEIDHDTVLRGSPHYEYVIVRYGLQELVH